MDGSSLFIISTNSAFGYLGQRTRTQCFIYWHRPILKTYYHRIIQLPPRSTFHDGAVVSLLFRANRNFPPYAKDLACNRQPWTLPQKGERQYVVCVNQDVRHKPNYSATVSLFSVKVIMTITVLKVLNFRLQKTCVSPIPEAWFCCRHFNLGLWGTTDTQGAFTLRY